MALDLQNDTTIQQLYAQEEKEFWIYIAFCLLFCLGNILYLCIFTSSIYNKTDTAPCSRQRVYKLHAISFVSLILSLLSSCIFLVKLFESHIVNAASYRSDLLCNQLSFILEFIWAFKMFCTDLVGWLYLRDLYTKQITSHMDTKVVTFICYLSIFCRAFEHALEFKLFLDMIHEQNRSGFGCVRKHQVSIADLVKVFVNISCLLSVALTIGLIVNMYHGLKKLALRKHTSSRRQYLNVKLDGIKNYFHLFVFAFILLTLFDPETPFMFQQLFCNFISCNVSSKQLDFIFNLFMFLQSTALLIFNLKLHQLKTSKSGGKSLMTCSLSLFASL